MQRLVLFTFVSFPVPVANFTAATENVVLLKSYQTTSTTELLVAFKYLNNQLLAIQV